MKFFIKPVPIYGSLVALLLMAASLLSGCGTESNPLTVITPAGGARVKVYHAASDATGLSVLLNDNQWSGVNTVPPSIPTLIAYGSAFPAQDYAVIPAGQANLKVMAPVSTTGASPSDLTLTTASLTAQDNTYYSVFVYGTSGNYKNLILTDDFSAKDASSAYIRFVNLVVGADADATYDLVYNGNVVVTGLSPSKLNSDFIPIPALAYGAAALPIQLRKTGSTTPLATNTLSPNAGRFYTVLARGVAGGTGAKILTATIYFNR